MESLFIDELDGTTYQTTAETFAEDWWSYLECLEEERIARRYGDCGYEI